MGENLTTAGFTEADVHLGDVLAVGDTVVQVTQPRSPCSKIAARYGRRDLAVLVQDTGYTGYLMRVLEEGDVAEGAPIHLVERQDHGMTVAEAGRIVNVDRHDLDGARRVLEVPGLGASVRRKLESRLRSPAPAGLDTARVFGDEAGPSGDANG